MTERSLEKWYVELQVFKAFGSSHNFIFMNRTLESTKIHIELSTWTIKAPNVRRLSTFHNHCVGTILGVS